MPTGVWSKPRKRCGTRPGDWYALPDTPRLLDELGSLVRCLDTGCRVAARRTHPSACQLLHDPHLGTVS